MQARPVRDEGDLLRILALQQANLARHLAPDEVVSQGFVTVEHTLDVLRRMQALAPSVVAEEEDGALAGYALVMPVECRAFVPILEPMFSRLDALGVEHLYVMGQICVARPFRGRGVFDLLYAGHRELLCDRFERVVTEVATRNTRSMRAHARVGFRELERYRDATDEWSLLAWEWRRGA